VDTIPGASASATSSGSFRTRVGAGRFGDPVDSVAVVAAPSLPTGWESLGRDLFVGIAVVVALAATFVLAPIGGSLGAVRLESAGRVLVAGLPVAVGMYAWRGVPFGRLGILLVLSGVVWLVVTFSLADRAVAYSIGRVAGWVGWTALVYLILAFPEGRLHGRVDRVLAGTLGLVAAVLWLPTALLVDRYPTPGDWVSCSASCPHNAFMIVGHEPGVVASVVLPVRELLVVLIFLAVVARLVQRVGSASRIRRRTLTPVLAVAIAGVGLTAFALVVRRFAPGSPAVTVARWLSAFALPAIALAFLVGLVRWRLYVGASLRRFAASVGSSAGPGGVRDAFADAFDDPTLAIVYPVAEDRWATADGRPMDAPTAGGGRSVTDLHDAAGHVVAVLVHDQALEDERAFINVIGSYASLSLENQRLTADVANLVREMRDTQARAAASADDTREQIERDLHDGAQQRLIALRIKLQLAAERYGDTATDTTEELNRLGTEVQLAIDELRALAAGVFPAVLGDFGPVAALRQAVRAAPVPTTVSGANVGRYRPEIERAVYFCCLEALQNSYKHAHTATAAHVTIAARGRELTFDVTDNGLGFDVGTVARGAGLHNMHDRIASQGGSLTIDAGRGHGTRITGAIPLTAGSSARTGRDDTSGWAGSVRAGD
jgi:signal transduction histidine kinase